MKSQKLFDGKYELLGELERGGFSVVYRGKDLLFDRPIAIKAIDPAIFQEARYFDILQAEAYTIARLNHPNIVHIYDFGRDPEGWFYIVMELVEGPDLLKLIKACRGAATPLPPYLGVHIVAQVAAGLDYLHNKRDEKTNEVLGLVHQDISPANIMVNSAGEVKIIDFGLATIQRKKSANKNEVRIQGKLSYLAPEQLDSQARIDHRADIFSLGLVFYEIITGTRLITSRNPSEIFRSLTSKRFIASKVNSSEVPVALRDALVHSLASSVKKRYQAANEIQSALVKYLDTAMPFVNFQDDLSDFINKLFLPRLQPGNANGAYEKDQKSMPEPHAANTISLAEHSTILEEEYAQIPEVTAGKQAPADSLEHNTPEQTPAMSNGLAAESEPVTTKSSRQSKKKESRDTDDAHPKTGGSDSDKKETQTSVEDEAAEAFAFLKSLREKKF